jgi:hypothetical protein
MSKVVEPLVGQAATKEIAEEIGLSFITTTLYDLIAAMQQIVGSNDDTVVVATIDHMLRSGRIAFLKTPGASDGRRTSTAVRQTPIS